MQYLPLPFLETLKSINVDELVPKFTVFDGRGSTVHLNAECSTALPRISNFTDVHLNRLCEVCERSSQANLFKKVTLEARFLHEILFTLKETEEFCAQKTKLLPRHIGSSWDFARPLDKVKRYLLKSCDDLENSDYFSSFAASCKDRLTAVDEALVTQLRSQDVQFAVEREFCGDKRPNLIDTHVLVDSEYLQTDYLTVVVSWGVEISKNRYLVSGSPKVLTYLSDLKSSSLLTVPEGTSEEVLFTLGKLWDPEGAGVFKSAAKAFHAAVELTSASR